MSLRALLAQLTSRLRLAPAAPPPATVAADTSTLMRPGWFALPGCRLEYRDTGLAITLATEPGQPAYTLHSPEGDVLAIAPTGLLEQVQQYAERAASEREAFNTLPPSNRT